MEASDLDLLTKAGKTLWGTPPNATPCPRVKTLVEVSGEIPMKNNVKTKTCVPSTVPSSKLTIDTGPAEDIDSLLNTGIFYCHVSLLEGNCG